MQCKRCGSKENLYVNATYTKKNGEVVKVHMCRACNTARLKKYRATPEGKKKTFEAIYRSTAKHMHKQLARVKLNYHVKRGYILKPNVCSECKCVKKLEAHHEDYTKPLDVIWFCRPCHFNHHKKVDSTKN